MVACGGQGGNVLEGVATIEVLRRRRWRKRKRGRKKRKRRKGRRRKKRRKGRGGGEGGERGEEEEEEEKEEDEEEEEGGDGGGDGPAAGPHKPQPGVHTGASRDQVVMNLQLLQPLCPPHQWDAPTPLYFCFFFLRWQERA
jgi:hypothetical protein